MSLDLAPVDTARRFGFNVSVAESGSISKQVGLSTNETRVLAGLEDMTGRGFTVLIREE